MGGFRKFISTAFAFFCLLDSVVSEESKDKGESEQRLLRKIDAPLLFMKRHSYRGIHIYDAFYKWPPGGGGINIVYNTNEPVKNWKERAIIDENSSNSLGKGVYSHPELHWSGKKLLFCYKGSPKGDTSIYEIGIDGTGLRRITDPSTAKVCYNGKSTIAGMHDLAPSYLPDDRIVFLSTRAEGLVPCNDSGVTLLHVMNSDGTDIHSISVNSENEFDPNILPDGRIIYGRWEYIDKNALTVQSLWTVWPDGSSETAVYANNMTFPEALLDPRPVPGTSLIAATLTKHNYHPRGTIAYIDASKGKNNPKAIFNFNSPNNPVKDTGNSCEPYPLDKNSLICSGRPKGYKRNVIEMLDRKGGRITILSDKNICLHSPMLVKPRKRPPILPELVDRTKKKGTFLVQNVYDKLEGVKKGEVKWLRVVEESSRVSKSPRSLTPYNQTFLVSGALAFAAKIYHGITPVSEEGTAFFNAPSGRLLSFQLLDKDMRLIRSMRSFIQAAPGTVRACVGCHVQQPLAPSGGRKALKLHGGPKELQPESWGTGYMDYPTMIQPIWDKHCINCHGGQKDFAARLDLTGGWTANFNNSYENLIDRKETQLIAHYISGIDCMNGTAHYSNQLLPVKSHGSATAPLAKVIMSGHKNRFPNMTKREKDLIMAWIDSNGLYYGNFNYTKHGYTSHDFNTTCKKLLNKMKEAGCVSCHPAERAPQSGVAMTRDWVNLQKPEFSRILRAPLAKGKNGFGAEICRNHKMDPRRKRITILKSKRYEHAVKPLSFFPIKKMPEIQKGGKAHVTFKDTNNKFYKEMLAIIKEGQKKVLSKPRVDMPGAVVIPGKDRMLVMPCVPEFGAKLTITKVSSGRRISWKRTATNIGLVAELHCGSTAEFTPTENTLLGQTLIDHFVDNSNTNKSKYYALVFTDGKKRSKPSYISVTEPK